MPSLSLRLRAELMEERILHSADIAPLLMAGAAADTLVQQPLQTASADVAVQRSEIVFVDAALPDAPSLLADLQAQRSAGRPIEIVMIEAGQDGIALIGTTLAARHDISAVHVLAHGSDGVVQLGSATLDAQTLLQRAGEVARWSTALTANAELLLYGGDLAQTAAGQRLLQDLAALTGADTQQATARAGSAIATAPNLGTAAAAPAVTTAAPQLASLPLNFEANLGQADAGIDYIARGSGVGIALADGNALLNLKDGTQGNVVRMTLAGAATDVQAQPEGAVTSRSNYLIGGSDASLQDVPNYAAVRYDGVYEGIDLRYHGQGHQLEYDFIVAPGADWRHIALDFEGVQALAIDADGALRLTLADAAGGTRSIRFAAPVSYQDGANGREAVTSSYVIGADGRVRFHIGAYDSSRALVIDPVLVYGSYLGGTGVDKARAVAVDAAGNAYVTGETASAAFPTTAGAYDTLQNSGSDVFVTKLNASGTAVVYSTFIGGSGDDVAWGIAVDDAGSAYVTGSTTSSNLPTVNAFQGARSGTQDAFFFKLNASGSALLYSTYYGGSGSAEVGYGIALDAADKAYITGDTDSASGIASAAAYDTALGGSVDAFLVKFDPTQTGAASRVFGSYLGGSSGSNGADHGLAVAVDTAGKAYVSGYTTANNFPTLNAYDSSSNGGDDAFLTVFNAAGNAITYSTYLGGSGNDSASGIALDAANKVYLSGSAGSGFPTKNAYDATYGGGTWDAIVVKIDPTLSGNASLVYSTYLGGAGTETAPNIVVDSLGRAHVIGFTSGSFPTTADALQATYAGGANDAFYATLGSKGNSLVYSTYLGGSGDDVGYAIARDDTDNIYLAGYSASSNFQQITGGAADSTANGNYDAFVVKFADQALTVTTTNDVLDGNTSSVAALLANKGADGKISLREAIIATNNTPGADAISLAAGTYTLSRTGAGEDAALTGDLDITDDLTITGADANTTFIDGAGADRVFDIRGGTVNMSDLTVRNGNIAAGKGGGFMTANNSSLALSDVAVTANKAGQGGAIDSGGILILDRVTIDGNSAATDGGGIYAESSGSGTLTNVTLSGNTASGKGGAIFTKVDLSITNSTIANNTAATAGGIYGDAGGGTATLTNTILANNAGGNTSKAIISLGHNIDSANTAGLTGPGDRINTNPLLGPLQYNGGTIKTLALLAGSPAINAGTASGAPAVDARELPRADGNTDIGAFEAGLITLSGNSVAENSANGTAIGVVAVNAADIVADGRFLAAGTPAMFTTYSNGQTLGGWTVTQAAVDLLGSTYDRSPLGGNAIDLAGGLPGFGGPAGAISQTLATVAGQQYQVSFELSGAWFVDSNVKNVRVTFAGTSQDIAISKPAGWNSATDMKWAQQTLNFTAASTSTVLSLASLNGNGAGPIVADVQVKTSPGSYTYSLIDDAGGRFAVNAVTGALTVANGSLLDYEAATSHDITVRASSGATLVGDQVFTIQVTNVNDPLVNTVPGAQSTNEDTTLVFSTANGNPVSITDAGAGSGNNEVTLSVTNGSLTLAGVAGLSFSAGDGTADTVMTFRGTQGAINTALDGLAYSPSANYNGGATLTLASKASSLLSLDIDTGLVGRYAFENGAALGTDTSPAAGYAGTVSGATAVNDAARGNVLALAGAGYVQTTGHYGNPANVTVAAWVNLTSADSSGAEVISLGDSLSLRLDQSDNTLDGAFYNGSTFIKTSYATTLAGTGWHHVAYTFNNTGNTATLYLDGTAVSTTSTPNSISYTLGANSFIGKHGNGQTTFDFNGKIDDARIYNRALGASEIAALASDLTLTDRDTVAITVLPVNDAPTITSNGAGASAAVNVAENSTAVTVVTATDVDLPVQTLAYSISGGADAARFTINSVTGVLSFIAAPNFEAPTDVGANNVYDVTVQASDGALTDTQAIAVTVTNVNDNNPVITSNGAGGSATVNVAENSTSVTTVTATDADALAALTYSISGGADAASFTINASTGVLRFVAAPNYEAPTDAGTNNIYDVTVRVSDGTLTDTQAIAVKVLDVNEFPVGPVSDVDAAANSVAENAGVGTVVGVTAKAVDADATNNLVTYALDNSAGGRFAIDAANGVVSVAGALDYATASSHTITVRATSADGSFSTAAFTIGVINVNAGGVGAISDADVAVNSVAENSPAGTLVGITASAVDPDVADVVTYSLADSAGGRFAINTTTGVVVVASGLNAEVATSHTIVVRADSTDGSFNTQNFTIGVADVNEFAVGAVSDADATANAIDENSAIGTPVGITALAVDADATNNSITYTLDNSAGGRFAIDGTTGVVTVAGAIDREVAPSHAIVVRATSADGSASTQGFTIAVNALNDNAPVITSDGGGAGASISVLENTSTVTTVTATDADLPAQTLVYSIVGGADQALFNIDAGTGVLRFATAPDFETPTDAGADNVYEVTVQASDGGLNTTQTLSVAVNPVNDNTPTITSNGGGASASVNVAENTTAVTTVTATDADLPAQTLTFTIVGGLDQALFNIDAGTGVLSFATAPDFEAPSDAGGNNVYDVTVQASDGGLSTTQDISVSIGNVNEAPTIGAPIANQSATQGTVFAFTLPAGTFIDVDAGDTLSYTATLTSGAALPSWLTFSATMQTFSGTPANGDVGAITVRVTATDASNASASGDFTLAVANANDAPVLAQPIAGQSATQGAAFAFTLPAATFTDIDVGDVLSYSATLTSGAALPSWLSFDATTQTFSGTPANGDVGAITVRVTAADTANATAYGDFALTVGNVNDAPVLAAAIANQSVMQGAAFGFTLPAGTFADIDVGDTLSYTATLASGAALPPWLIFNGATQTFSGTPGNANVGAVTVRITVADAANATASGDFTLTVANVNDVPVLAQLIAGQTATQGVGFAFTVPAGTFDDIDVGDSLSYGATLASGAALPGWLSFNGATQTFSGTPGNADVGAISVRVTATDMSNVSASGDFTLTVANVNDAPVLAAAIASQSATQGAAFAVTLPAGTFTDADAGDTLTYTATLASGAALPSWLNFNGATQTFSGTPGNADVGAATIRVTAADIANATAFGDFALTVANVNDAPVLAQPIAGQTATQGAVFGFTLPAGAFTDADAGDTLSYSATLASGAALPSWLSFNAATQTFSGTPVNADVGSQVVRVTATDTANATAFGDFTLTVANVNDAPVLATPIASQSATQGGAFNFTLPAGTFTDIDAGDTLSYRATLSSGAALPSWLSFSAATQSFTGTPGNADVGSPTVRVTAADIANAAAFGDFTLTVANVNDAPVLAQPIAGQTATQSAAFAFTLPAGTFTDIDAGDTLNYSTTLASGAALPSWLNFNATTRTFSGTPANGDVGTITVRVTAADTANATAFGDFTLTVVNTNDAPVLAQPIANQSATQGAAFAFTVPAGTFTDVDAGDTLSYSATLASGAALPSWLTFNGTTRTFIGTPANADVGAITVRLTATDGGNASASGDFSLAVANVNDAPVLAQPIGDHTVFAGTPARFQLPAATFTDPDVGDTLHYAAALADGTALPAWLTFDASTLAFTAAPAADQIGAFVVRVTATDDSGAAAQALFAVVVTTPTFPAPPAAADAGAAPAAPTAAPPAATPAAAVAATSPATHLATAPAPVATPVADALAPAMTFDSVSEAPQHRGSAGITDSTGSRPVSRSDAVLANFIAPEYKEVELHSLVHLLKSDDVLRRLEETQRHMLEQGFERRTVVASAIAATSGLSVGYVIWLVRGGVLVSSMLSALPAWQMIDPLPVVAAAGVVRTRRSKSSADDADVERLFDEHRKPSTAPAPAPAADAAAAKKPGPKETRR